MILETKYQTYWCVFDLPSKEKKIQELEKESLEPLFWQDSTSAQSKMKTLAELNGQVSMWKGLREQIQANLDLVELAILENDFSFLDEIRLETDLIDRKIQEEEFTLTLSGEHDQRDAILAIHAGAGGVDSQDWAAMLTRMYARWCDRKGFNNEI